MGKPNSGWGCLTGQGGREHGQKADQLPGYRLITDPAARRHVAAVWGVDEAELPGPGKSAFELLDSLGQDGGVRCLMIMGSNVAVSAPDSLLVEQRLKALDFLVVADFFLSETAQLADVVLPSAQWAEEQGTMTNLEPLLGEARVRGEPRRPGDTAAAGFRPFRRRPHRPGHHSRPGPGPGQGIVFLLPRRRGRVRRALPGQRRRPRRLLGHELRENLRQPGNVLALPR